MRPVPDRFLITLRTLFLRRELMRLRRELMRHIHNAIVITVGGILLWLAAMACWVLR